MRRLARKRLRATVSGPLGRPVVLLAVLGTGVFLGALDQTVVVTALPAIIRELEIPFTRLAEASWIVTAYLLGYTVALPLVGRLADVYGHVRLYLACLLVFALGSLLAGLARSLEALVVARAIQALGGGAILPVTLAVASDLFAEERRPLALGAIGALAEAGGVLGPLYGGVIAERLDWRWIFYLNLPVGLAIVGLVLLGRGWRAEPGGARGVVDYPGALLLGLGLGALTLGLSQEGSQPGSRPISPELVALALGAFVAFVAWERRAPAPLVDLALFRCAPFSAANLTNLLVGAALIVVLVDVPLWSATVLGRDPLAGGLLLLRLTLLIPVGALVGGVLTRWLGPRLTALLGLAAAGASLTLLAHWRPDTPELVLTGDLALGGLGFGLLVAPVTAVAVGWAGAARAGLASSLVTVQRMVGMMLGLAALTAWGLRRFQERVADLPLPLPEPGEAAEAFQQRVAAYQAGVLDATLATYQEVFLAGALVCLVAVAPALLLRRARLP